MSLEHAFNPKRILKLEPPRSFKGHYIDVVVMHPFSHDDKGSISINQRYLGGSVSQRFDIKAYKTYSSYTVTTGKTPKWLQTKITNIGDEYLPPGKGNGQLIVDGNPKIDIWGEACYASYATEEDGCAFQNHFENINELKRLTGLLRRFKLQIKNLYVSEIMEFVEGGQLTNGVIKLSKNIIK